MRILFNLSEEDKPYQGMLKAIIKQHDISGVASLKKYDLSSIQKLAQEQSCGAIFVTNPGSLKEIFGRPEATLDAYRGSRFNFKTPIFIGNPLEHLVKVPYGRWLFERDLEKTKHAHIPAQQFRWQRADTAETRRKTLIDAQDCVLMAYDIETNPSIQAVTCVSFAMLMPDNEIKIWVIPFLDFTEIHYQNENELGEAFQCYRDILNTPCPKVAQNGIYDATYSLAAQAAPRNYIYDTMIMSWARYSELYKSLDFIASLYLYDYIQWKHEADEASQKKDIMSYWAYCAKDSWTTLRIAIQQMMISKPSDYWIHNYKRTFRLTFPSIYTAFEGCALDLAKMQSMKEAAKKELTEIEQEFKIMTNEPAYNPASPQQVSVFFYDILGAVRPKTAKSKSATDEKSLNRIAIQHPLIARLVDRHLQYKEKQKLVTTYYTFEPFNGRALWAIDPTGTESGRMASKKSAFGFWNEEERESDNLGLQIQNIPTEGVKAFFIPDPDYILVEIDKSKSEARCVGYLAKCWKMVEALEDKERDYYMVLSSEFFGIPYEKVTKYMRNKLTKKIIHGSNYMLGAETFISSVTPKELFNAMGELGLKMNLTAFAKYLLSLYHKSFPELKGDPDKRIEGWYTEIQNELKNTKHLTSPLGWTRRFFGDITGSRAHATLRSAVAHKPQNLSVDLLNEDFWQDYKVCIASGGKVRLKAQIHDSRLMQIHKSIINNILPSLVNRTQSIKINGREMIIPSECKFSANNWQDMEEWDGVSRIETA